MFIEVCRLSCVCIGIDCVQSLSTLQELINTHTFPTVTTFADVGVSIITPPGVTLMILEEGYRLGARNFFLQPGTYDKVVDDYISKNLVEATCIKGCVLVELGFSDDY
jgi:hypothetical protein